MQKVLIIAYYWPPAGGPGVQRWLKFVSYLRDFGIEPIVFVPENPNYPIVDESLVDEIPEGIKVLKQPIFEPYGIAKIFSKKSTEKISSGIIEDEKKQNLLQQLLLFIRGNFFIPDARKFWVKPSVKYLESYIKKNNINTIITTGPPHSLHLIGLQLKQKLGVNWLADFRDPWTSIGYHEKLKLTKKASAKHKALEKQVLQEASHIITTSFKTKEEFLALTSTEISVITNGYEKQALLKKNNSAKKFTIAHIGSLLSERNPIALWQALAEIIEENNDFKKLFQLQLIGKVSGQVFQSIKKAGLKNHAINIGYVSHLKAIEFQQQAQVLLLLEIDRPETEAIIPGKLFEYLAAKRPIIAIGPKAWDVSKILAEVKMTPPFLYDEKEKIKQEILKYFNDFQQNSLEVSSEGIEKYSRKNLTKNLAEILRHYA
ncbi:glycosyltransferase family protein [Mesonia aquimarina]|uniref:glycosyl transferase family 1 n=1 Tax=Mesonia aquimarina TaxID=1504967 RepID=UPI000EF58F51|nr:glycosyl transferase family 1 [Mesonia aquimarina]